MKKKKIKIIFRNILIVINEHNIDSLLKTCYRTQHQWINCCTVIGQCRSPDLDDIFQMMGSSLDFSLFGGFGTLTISDNIEYSRGFLEDATLISMTERWRGAGDLYTDVQSDALVLTSLFVALDGK